eukprot:765140-Rhodomonas_salina.1
MAGEFAQRGGAQRDECRPRGQGAASLSSYTQPVRCPVLTQYCISPSLVLRIGMPYAMSGTHLVCPYQDAAKARKKVARINQDVQ